MGKGDSLFDTLSEWRSGSPPLYLGLVRIGEKTGDLATIFQRLSDYLVGRQALRSKTVSSLVYPVFVLAIAVIGIILLATLILPGLTGMIGSLNPQAAALYQRNVLRFQTGAGVFGPSSPSSAALSDSRSACERATRWARPPRQLPPGVPVLGRFFRVAFGLNFSFAMETLLTSGYTLEEALEEGSWAVGNLRYRDGLMNVRDRVVKGVLLSEALRQERVFPQVLIGWMAVGEGAHDLVKSSRRFAPTTSRRPINSMPDS